MMLKLARQFGFVLAFFLLSINSTAAAEDANETKPVSYYGGIRPIFQRHCHGCHQPAKASGGYEMTSFENLLAGGDTEFAAVTAEDVDESHLLELITPDDDGAAEMPKGKPALSEAEIAKIRRWIQEGAENDTPETATKRFTAENPPTYNLSPVITAVAFSPDGNLLAVAGYHEVLLHKADGSQLVARLVGMSERIESLAFSPSGKQLAVTGGSPGRMGEVQIWDVEKKTLTVSYPVTFDTVYGASWSPDGKLVGFGCADTTLRAIEVDSAKQVLFQGAHDDWVLDTVFSVDGKHIVSAGRDMTLKLTVVETERFVDNITSITPGALKGGIHAVARHPKRDELLVGGSDGVPKTYRMHREAVRRIGDDSNLIRQFPGMPGRVFDVAYNHDGTQFIAASSKDGKGYLYHYESPQDTEKTPDEIKKIQEKVASSRSKEEKQKLDEYHTAGAKLLHQLAGQQAGVYGVAFSPDGKTIASAGMDGVVRLNSTDTGELIKEFVPVPVESEAISK